MLLQLLAIIINFIPILIAIILHEVAHGYAAYKFGDDTAKKYGRLSLNPLRHIDLFGSIIIPALLYYSGVGFVFGWAKPVPVNFNNLKNKWQEFIVAAAGIIANILLALVFAMLLRVENLISLPVLHNVISVFLLNMVVYNIVLAIFNILPIPPLDGSKIFFGWMKNAWAKKYVNSEQSGMVIIVGIAFILPYLGKMFSMDFNILGWYMINMSKFFISLLV